MKVENFYVLCGKGKSCQNKPWLLLMGFCFVLLMIEVASGVSVCIDNENPGAPDGLSVSGNVGNILIEWLAAADFPSCSGILEYVVSRNGVEIGRVEGGRLSIIDTAGLGNGEYSYTVYAVDLVGRNVGTSVKNIVAISSGGSGGGGSSSGFVCEVNWSCGNWSDCVGGNMKRICVDLGECGTPYLKPNEYLECESEVRDIIDVESEVLEDEEEGFRSLISGALIGGGVGTQISWVVFIIVLIVAFAIYSNKKKSAAGNGKVKVKRRTKRRG